ncbi:MAG: hypothetical protein WC867_05615 [Candidatus Pacearchaeota archaeon]|jgi:hypothetical protein
MDYYFNNIINELMKDCLKSRFQLYNSRDKVQSIISSESPYIYLRYFTLKKSKNNIKSTTHLDIEINKDICYLLDIELDRDFRGKGYG